MSTTVRQRITGSVNIGTVVLQIASCCSCGVIFALTADLDKRRREDHGYFYCPNGHSQHYAGKTEAQKLREQLEAVERQRDRAQARGDSWRDQAHAAERSARAVKGHLTRLRRRIANGVCPCCQRSFANVRQHIAGQHPEWAAEHAHVLDGGVS